MKQMPSWAINHASWDMQGCWEVTMDTRRETGSTFTTDVVERATGVVVGKLSIVGYPNPFRGDPPADESDQD